MAKGGCHWKTSERPQSPGARVFPSCIEIREDNAPCRRFRCLGSFGTSLRNNGFRGFGRHNLDVQELIDRSITLKFRSVSFNAFISHAAEDGYQALQLRQWLADEGVNCWCFEEDLRYAEHIETKVIEAIAKSDCVIVIVSPNALESTWVRWEVGYAIQLRAKRGGVPRPTLVPVHLYEELPDPCELQPLRIGTDQSLGVPVPFHRHRCYRLHDKGTIPRLAECIKPKITRITDPRGVHSRLFDGVGRLMEELFPNELDRPDIDEIGDWLEADIHQPETQLWPEVLLASHLGDEVTGYIYMNYSAHFEIGYAAFFGISAAWRQRTSMKWLLERGREEMKRLHSECRGVLFEVDTVDLNIWTADAPTAESDSVLENVNRLRRIHLFQTVGALLLVDGLGNPIKVPQYSLKPPLGPETELEHFLMLYPFKAGEVPTVGEWLVQQYTSLAAAGFGPHGVNIPDYSDYLTDFSARLGECIPYTAKFSKLFITNRMRVALRQSGESGVSVL